MYLWCVFLVNMSRNMKVLQVSNCDKLKQLIDNNYEMMNMVLEKGFSCKWLLHHFAFDWLVLFDSIYDTMLFFIMYFLGIIFFKFRPDIIRLDHILTINFRDSMDIFHFINKSIFFCSMLWLLLFLLFFIFYRVHYSLTWRFWYWVEITTWRRYNVTNFWKSAFTN